jgi:regulatory protein
LRRRGHSDEAVDRALDRLRRSGYVDDRSYALRFARSRLRHQGLGRARIRAALRARGVERETLEDGLAEALGEVSEDQVLDDLARRYWEGHRRDPPVRRLRKLWAFLLRRGFPGGLVAERLRALFSDRGEELDGLSGSEGETA